MVASKMTNYIWVTAEEAFMHRYNDAPRTVSFLKNEHRHNFKFRIYIEIFSNDRDIEFIIFQRFIKGILFKLPFNLRNTSCEMLADIIEEKIREKYSGRRIKIEVSEDGENGVIKTYPKPRVKKNKNIR